MYTESGVNETPKRKQRASDKERHTHFDLYVVHCSGLYVCVEFSLVFKYKLLPFECDFPIHLNNGHGDFEIFTFPSFTFFFFFALKTKTIWFLPIILLIAVAAAVVVFAFFPSFVKFSTLFQIAHSTELVKKKRSHTHTHTHACSDSERRSIQPYCVHWAVLVLYSLSIPHMDGIVSVCVCACVRLCEAQMGPNRNGKYHTEKKCCLCAQYIIIDYIGIHRHTHTYTNANIHRICLAEM